MLYITFFFIEKKRKNNYKKVKNDIFEQEENQLNKLSRIAKLIEKRDIYNYNSLYCPIC